MSRSAFVFFGTALICIAPSTSADERIIPVGPERAEDYGVQVSQAAYARSGDRIEMVTIEVTAPTQRDGEPLAYIKASLHSREEGTYFVCHLERKPASERGRTSARLIVDRAHVSEVSLSVTYAGPKHYNTIQITGLKAIE
jgi:hypothetical protein